MSEKNQELKSDSFSEKINEAIDDFMNEGDLDAPKEEEKKVVSTKNSGNLLYSSKFTHSLSFLVFSGKWEDKMNVPENVKQIFVSSDVKLSSV